jgi:hypothetical protein
MNSFIFSFKTVFAALFAIVGIETAIFAVHPSSFVERSNYLDWNYGKYEIFHKAMIYQKLDDFAYAAPDIIEVGDSSALHNVNPDIVTKYLGGLKFVNLGSIANAGFDGHYALADFMFRRNPSIKALVLYVTLRHLPDDELVAGDQFTGGADRIRNSFTAIWAYLNPPSMALRRDVTEAVYSGWGAVRRRETHFFEVGEIFADMLASIHEHNGWWPEHDARYTGPRAHKYWNQFCDDQGIGYQEDSYKYYIKEPLITRQSYFRFYLQKFADLAARYGAKMVIVFQPFPCQELRGSFLAARRADLQYVREHNKNFFFEPESIFEHWPIEAFTTGDHLRVGYDTKNSERVGRLLAGVLGISVTPHEPVEAPTAQNLPAVAPRSIWSDTGTDGVNWQTEGASVSRAEGSGRSPAALRRVTDSQDSGVHLLKIPLEDIEPGQSYVVSLVAKAIGNRELSMEIFDADSPVRQSSVNCDLRGLEASRGVGALDGGIELLPDGWLRCWLSVRFRDRAASVRLILLNDARSPVYAGDGSSGVLISDLTIQPGRHP